jgi:hypothetical protein
MERATRASPDYLEGQVGKREARRQMVAFGRVLADSRENDATNNQQSLHRNEGISLDLLLLLIIVLVVLSLAGGAFVSPFVLLLLIVVLVLFMGPYRGRRGRL